MITIGVDAHKQVHAAVALDSTGRELAPWRGAHTATGWGALQQWAAHLGAPRQWGSEGAWNYGRGLAHDLRAAGAQVYEINPRWTAEGRRRARRPGKSAALDASAVARVGRRAASARPQVTTEDETALLALLVTARASAVAAVPRRRNQLHQQLRHLDPEDQVHLPRLRTTAGLAALAQYAATAVGTPSSLVQARAAAVRRLAQRLKRALQPAEELAAQIRQHAQVRCGALTRSGGVSLLTAGARAGILGPGQRFRTDAQLAASAGGAPLEASSAGQRRHRLNRGGNRRRNAILHRIAVAHARCSPAARAYLQRREAGGQSRREAIRALKRFLIRAGWRAWQDCRRRTHALFTAPATVAAGPLDNRGASIPPHEPCRPSSFVS
jgi:transposase